ncbi:MAG: lipopolysaccharide biosynthesis protein [Bacteroidales bacterium]|nr:lipopolysaccharide biosynthesis protein [Bacteroidales bacterium]
MAKQSDIKQKAAASMVWTAFSKYSNMIIGFISGIILARLLTPYDYGCIGMLSIFMALSETFIDAGFGSALIQKKNPTQEDYSTIFFWNMGMSVVMYVILFFSAPAIARFYNIPMLSSVLRVQGLILFIYALNLIQRNQLKKKLNFKVLGILSVSTSIIALTVTIWMAYRGYGVWALVVQNIITAAIPCLVFWFYVKWRPKLVFSWKSFKELFGFGVYMFLTHITNTFCSKLNGLLIGKIYSPVTLGYFSKASSTESLASHSISSIMTTVTYPLYASVQDDRERMINMLRRLTNTIAYVTFPLMFVLILTAKPIFVLLYSDKWIQSVPYFQVLCIVGLSACLQSVNTQTLAAVGKSRLMFMWTLAKRSVGLVFMIGGLYFYGMKGFLVGIIVYNWFCYFVNIGLVSKYIGFKWQQQLLDLLPMAAASLIAASVSYGVAYFCHLGLYLDGVLKAVLCLGIYMAWSWIFQPDAYKYTLTIIPEKFKFWERKTKRKR